MLLHVRYVSDGGPQRAPLDVLQAAFTDPWGLAAVLAVAVGLAAYVWLTTRWSAWQPFRERLAAALHDDQVLVPWVLRLSVGISALGAGLEAHWIVAHVPIEVRGPLAFLFIAAGFAVLVGLAVRIAAAALLLAWLAALFVHGMDLFMAAEVVAAALLLVARAAGRPSLDAYLAAALPAAPAPWRRLARLGWLLGPRQHPVPVWGGRLLQVGLGVSFAAAGLLEKLLDPGPALAIAERYGLALGPVSPEVVVATAGLLELALGLLLAFGVAPRPLAALAFLVLTVTLFALPDDPVVAHVSLWGVASAVFLLGPRPHEVADPGIRPPPS